MIRPDGVERAVDIGRDLRRERERLGLTLQRAEADTKIRARYLAALEDERFDELPDEAYVRGFLRSYAAYLDLDGAALVAGYRARVQVPEPAIAPMPVGLRPRRRAGPLLLAAAAALVAAVGLGAWQLGGEPEHAAPSPTPPHPESIEVTPAAPEAPAEQAPAPAPPPRVAPLPTAVVLSARGGNCWLDVRIGGPAGPRAWTGTLRQGQTLRLGLSRTLFIRAGAPHNLYATIGGRVQQLQPGNFDLVATREGVRPRA